MIAVAVGIVVVPVVILIIVAFADLVGAERKNKKLELGKRPRLR